MNTFGNIVYVVNVFRPRVFRFCFFVSHPLESHFRAVYCPGVVSFLLSEVLEKRQLDFFRFMKMFLLFIQVALSVIKQLMESLR